MRRLTCLQLLLVLLPLMFLAPADLAGTAQQPAIERGSDLLAGVMADRPLHREQLTAHASNWTGTDDDDRSARTKTVVACAAVSTSVCSACATGLVRRTHSDCAPLPRGPPPA